MLPMKEPDYEKIMKNLEESVNNYYLLFLNKPVDDRVNTVIVTDSFVCLLRKE